jgi:hypothetical protein
MLEVRFSKALYLSEGLKPNYVRPTMATIQLLSTVKTVKPKIYQMQKILLGRVSHFSLPIYTVKTARHGISVPSPALYEMSFQEKVTAIYGAVLSQHSPFQKGTRADR